MAAVAPEVADQARPVTLAGHRLLPVLAGLEELLPGRGLRRGSTVAVTGCPSLALALVAGPSIAGSWCAAVGLPSLGLAAAGELGVVLPRLALVPEPGREWASVVATVVDAVDLVLVAPPAGGVRPSDARRLAARCRERGAVLVVVGPWDGADVRLGVVASRWEGMGQGCGHLRARRVEVEAQGRGAAARPFRTSLWLPAEDGRVCELGAKSHAGACDLHARTPRGRAG
ncbi:MAG: hypothetical protein ABIP72_01510 [Acidimicrobiales bacterium]